MGLDSGSLAKSLHVHPQLPRSLVYVVAQPNPILVQRSPYNRKWVHALNSFGCDWLKWQPFKPHFSVCGPIESTGCHWIEWIMPNIFSWFRFLMIYPKYYVYIWSLYLPFIYVYVLYKIMWFPFLFLGRIVLLSSSNRACTRWTCLSRELKINIIIIFTRLLQIRLQLGLWMTCHRSFNSYPSSKSPALKIFLVNWFI